jgi:hypothetical protein
VKPIVIRVSIRAVEPVAGEAALDGGAPAPFEGWLDLLQRLSELLATRGPSRADRFVQAHQDLRQQEVER